MELITVVPYGVLGRSLRSQKASEPDEETAFVDPAGMHHIQGGGPWGASGAAGANYEWLGIADDESFPEDVVEAIQEPLQAKFHAYGERGAKKCIHVVGPDFRMKDRGFTEDDAVQELALAYSNTLREFCTSGLRKLRLLPISGGIFSGPFKDDLPELTVRALQAAFKQMPDAQMRHLQTCSIEMCIFMESELDVFQSAFTPATAASEPTAAATPSAAAPETKTAAEAADPEPA